MNTTVESPVTLHRPAKTVPATSDRWPGLAKGGNSAVIITAAAFFSAGLTPGGKVRPKREIAPFMPKVE
jgi:hypothetical protein